jgi:uncharacterized protein with PQ loop repeat
MKNPKKFKENPKMVAEQIVTYANVCQLIVPFIAIASYLPQWIKLYRIKSSTGVSLRSWCLWAVSSIFTLFYAIIQLLLNGRGWSLVISTGITLTAIILTVVLILRYRVKPIRTKKAVNQFKFNI